MAKISKKNNDKKTTEVKSVKCLELEKRANSYIQKWGTKHQLKQQSEETNRTEFRRQRDRILYSGGFRRLQDKTQVLGAGKNGDHRTRLTHSLEVEQIAISLAESLGLNRDLVSAIALGHDVGHTPFGHAVERFLNEKLSEQGGFSHAVQSIRYLKLNNINLSDDILQGILKHDTDVYLGAYDKLQFDCTEFSPDEPGNLEAQAVYWADKIAYITHDFEDFYKSNIYDEAIENNDTLQKELQDILSKLTLNNSILDDIENFKTRDLIRTLLKNLTNMTLETLNNDSNQLNSPNDAVELTKKRIRELENKSELSDLKLKLQKKDGSKVNIFSEFWMKINKNTIPLKKEEKEILDIKKAIKSTKKSCYQAGLVINFQEDYMVQYQRLRKILDDYYIMSPEVKRSDAKAIKLVEALYDEFTSNFGILPLNIQKKKECDGSTKERIIADYIASMTDRYAEEVYNNLNSIGNYYKY